MTNVDQTVDYQSLGKSRLVLYTDIGKRSPITIVRHFSNEIFKFVPPPPPPNLKKWIGANKIKRRAVPSLCALEWFKTANTMMRNAAAHRDRIKKKQLASAGRAQREIWGPGKTGLKKGSHTQKGRNVKEDWKREPRRPEEEEEKKNQVVTRLA